MKPDSGQVSRGRRAFVRGAMLTSEGRQRYQNTVRALGPAPPWHYGRLQADVCAQCDQLCATSCQQNIISIHPAEHALAGVPYLDLQHGGCTWCGACADVCPMNIQRTTEQPRFAQVSLNTANCLAWNGVICVSCQSHCDYQAIHRDQRSRIEIDVSTCTGCGNCISVCPEAAITMQVNEGSVDLTTDQSLLRM
jgi:ferredoxin-type protein NapF